jgi:drug/metabolite transporter (DMT)-like permease
MAVQHFPAPGLHPVAARFRADALLLVAAVIWGTTFVAQRSAMAHLGPYWFNGIRFALGALALLPVCLRPVPTLDQPLPRYAALLAAGAAGLVLFAGATLQQIGLIYTTAGKAGFITGLYVVLVPLLGAFVERHASRNAWIGAGLALGGLYLLSITGPLRMSRGDFLVLLSALFWAVHILVLDRFSSRMNPYQLAAVQAGVCSACSLGIGMLVEPISLSGLKAAAWPILYGGLMSVGVAYTLQIVAQKHAPPAHVAILLSLEAVFAVFAGWILLGETLTTRALAGCGLMLAGMLASQWRPTTSRPTG